MVASYEGINAPYVQIATADASGRPVATSAMSPVPTDPSTGAEIFLVNPPAALNAGSETLLTFSQRVNHVTIQNNSSSSLTRKFDATATAGSYFIPPASGGQPAVASWDWGCTVLHLWSATAIPLNGSAAGGLVIEGAL